MLFKLKCVAALALCAANFTIINAQNIRYSASAEADFGSGDFAPYYLVSNKHGVKSINPNSGYIRGGIFKDFNEDSKFTWSAGIDLIGSYNSDRNARIQQLYADVKLYCLGLSVGMKEYNGEFKNQELSSGSMVWSGNSAPIPQVRAGIPEFVNIPLTNGWVQIKGDLSYGKFIDNKFLKDNFSYKNGQITTDVWYHQKQFFLRSKESKPFVVTIGAELAAQFCGDYSIYKDGVMTHNEKNKPSFKALYKVFKPQEGGEGDNMADQVYYYGNHLGAWHGIAEYKFKNNSRLKGYFEWFFEDASGMGKMNGFDGLWGLEYTFAEKGYITDIVFEYLQTTNQSGPIHWASDDHAHEGTFVTGNATGADDYYNNYYYNGWAHHGMSVGTPMLKSTAYNESGYLKFTDTQVRAFHLGVAGYILPELRYKVLASYRESWGSAFLPALEVRDNFSYAVELNYTPERFKGWEVGLSLGQDIGDLYGNNFGAGISLKKSGKIFSR